MISGMKFRKLISLLSALALVVGTLPTVAFAASFNDTSNHWAEKPIDRWTDAKVLSGMGDGSYAPDEGMNRGQSSQVFANLLHLDTSGTTTPFSDVSPNAWYAPAIAATYKANIMKGVSATKAAPEMEVDRETFLTLFGRAVGVQEQTTSNGIANDSSSWARGIINALINKGYLKGDGNTVDAKGLMSRGSIAALLDQTVTVYADKDGGTYSGTGAGMALIVADNVTLTGEFKDVAVATDGDVTLENATVKETMSVVDGADVTLEGQTSIGDAYLNDNADNATVTVGESAAFGSDITNEADNVKIINNGEIAGDVNSTGANTEVTNNGEIGGSVTTEGNGSSINNNGTVGGDLTSGNVTNNGTVGGEVNTGTSSGTTTTPSSSGSRHSSSGSSTPSVVPSSEKYVDENGQLQAIPSTAFIVDSTNNSALDINGVAVGSTATLTGAPAGTFTWIVIDGDVTFDHRISVLGTANLVLKDGCTLTANKGIELYAGTNNDPILNIYGQSEGTGKLTATGTLDIYAGIGGIGALSVGKVTINGGIIAATGGSNSAGIGGGYNGSGGIVTINGGTVTATGGGAGAEGIGKGIGGSSSGTLMIADGISVYAESSEITSSNLSGLTAKATGPQNNVSDRARYMYAGSASSSGGGGTAAAVEYIDAAGDTQSCSQYTTVSSSASNAWSGGWYVVSGDVTISNRIYCDATIDLILTDGCTLTASKGIQVPSGSTLNIYAQSGGTGRLVATGENYNSAIGGPNGNAAGTITINGGVIVANGGSNAAGIGGGQSGAGGTVTINRGEVTANGGFYAQGIGRGNSTTAASGTLTLGTGVSVYANANSAIDTSNLPAALATGPVDNAYSTITPLRYMYVKTATATQETEVNITGVTADSATVARVTLSTPVAGLTKDNFTVTSSALSAAEVTVASATPNTKTESTDPESNTIYELTFSGSGLTANSNYTVGLTGLTSPYIAGTSGTVMWSDIAITLTGVGISSSNVIIIATVTGDNLFNNFYLSTSATSVEGALSLGNVNIDSQGAFSCTNENTGTYVESGTTYYLVYVKDKWSNDNTIVAVSGGIQATEVV